MHFTGTDRSVPGTFVNDTMGGEEQDTDLPARKEEERFQYFIRMLTDEDVSRRWKAAEALARIGDTRAVEPLIQALSDDDWRVRQKVAWALGYLGDPRAITPLRRAYPGDLEGVQEMITEAIEMIRRKTYGR